MNHISDLLEEYKEVQSPDEKLPILTLTEKNGFVYQADRFSKRLATENTDKYKVITRDAFAFNPYLLWAGAIAHNDLVARGIISPLYPTFKVRAGVDPTYVKYLLLSPAMIAKYDTIAFGSVPRRRRSSVKDFLNLPIPALPPLEEQKRIALTEELQVKIAQKREHQQALFDEFEASLFKSMFRDENNFVRLGYVADFIGGSSLPEGEIFTGQEGGVLLMKVSDMNTPGNETNIHTTSLWTSDYPNSRQIVPAGSVVLPKRGASIATNKKRLTTRPMLLDPNLMAIVPNSENLHSLFLYHWFLHFDLSTITSGSSVPQLNKKDLSPLSIKLPSNSQQKKFIEILSTIRR